MKKVISVFFSILCCVFFVTTVVSCDSFLSGELLKKNIEQEIEYQNQPSFNLQIDVEAPENGKILPSGSRFSRVTDKFTVTFKPSNEYQFVKWVVKDYKTNLELTDVLKIIEPEELETEVEVIGTAENAYLYPLVYKRPAVETFSPVKLETGSPKDSSIIFTFTKKLSTENDLKRIQITCGGDSVASNFLEPVLNENIITIAANKNNLLDVTGGKIKTVTVKLPADFYYIENGKQIPFGSDISYSYNVNSTTIDKAEVTISAPAEKGEISPKGTQSYNIGDVVKISFTPNADYNFTGWNILDGEGNEVPDSVLKFDSRTDFETSFTVLKEVSGVSITPKSILIPSVISISPESTLTGVSCYSPIRIKFNMAMSAEELNNTWEHIVIRNNIYGDLRDTYFNKPILSEDGKTLTIRPKENKIKDLFESTTIIGIDFSFAGIIHTKGEYELSLDEFSYSYSINKIILNSVPTITSVVLSHDQLQQKLLTDSVFAPELWKEKDYINLNHIGNSVYVSCKGVESEVPITSVLVTETLVYEIDETQVTPNRILAKDNVAETAVFSEINISEYATNVFKYNLATGKEGVIKLSFRLRDAENKVSEYSMDYYVISDTGLNCLETIKFGKYTNAAENNYSSITKIADENGMISVELYKITGLTEEYYKNCYSPLHVKIVYWDDGETEKKLCLNLEGVISTDGELDISNYTILRHCDKETYLELYVEDNFGNSFTDDYVIPKSGKIAYLSFPSSGYGKPTVYTKKYVNLHDDLTYEEKVLIRKVGDEGFTLLTANTITNLTQGQEYEIGVSNAFYKKSGTQNRYQSFGCFSEIKKVKYISSGVVETIYPSVGKENVVWPELVDYGVIDPAVNNSSYARCYLDFDFTNATSDVDYFVYLWDTGYNYIYDYKDFYIETGSKYYIYIKAVDKNGIIVSKNAHSYSEFFDLESTDITPPTVELEQRAGHTPPSGNFRPDGFVVGINDTVVQDSSGINNTISYYYRENSGRVLSTQLPITEEILNYKNDKSTTIPSAISSSEQYVVLPIDSPENTYYSVFLTFYDTNNNYKTVTPNKAVSTIVKDKTKMTGSKYSFVDGGQTYKGLDLTFKHENGTTKVQSQMYSYFHNGKWIDMYLQGLSYAGNTSLSSDLYDTDNFIRFYCYFEDTDSYRNFTKTLYFHSAYITSAERKCNSVNMIEGTNGLQIYADKPVLVQTLYSKGNYGTDADMWATKALEADVKYVDISGDFTYRITDSIKNKIPDGNNYCVVVHYVDGTALMSSVYQK